MHATKALQTHACRELCLQLSTKWTPPPVQLSDKTLQTEQAVKFLWSYDWLAAIVPCCSAAGRLSVFFFFFLKTLVFLLRFDWILWLWTACQHPRLNGEKAGSVTTRSALFTTEVGQRTDAGLWATWRREGYSTGFDYRQVKRKDMWRKKDEEFALNIDISGVTLSHEDKDGKKYKSMQTLEDSETKGTQVAALTGHFIRYPCPSQWRKWGFNFKCGVVVEECVLVESMPLRIKVVLKVKRGPTQISGQWEYRRVKHSMKKHPTSLSDACIFTLFKKLWPPF